MYTVKYHVPAPEIMDIQEAAKYLQLSADTVYRYANERRIPSFRLGNRWRFRKSRLDQWCDSGGTDNPVVEEAQ